MAGVFKILERIGKTALYDNFRQQRVDSLELCRSLTDDDLKELGIGTIGDRAAFRDAVNRGHVAAEENNDTDSTSRRSMAMVHTGMGPVQINSLLTTLNLPPVDTSTLKRNEQKIDKTLEAVAKESCSEAQKEEKERGGGKVELSFDGGWQKWGTGWNYDSNTGHSSLIGKETGKVLEFSWRSRSCHTCMLHQRKNHVIPVHDCCKNWEGSSKAMEPDMAISMARNMSDAGCPIDVIHGDNDSTTAARLKSVLPNIKKKDDSNHTKKSFASKIYKLAQKNKTLKQPGVIPYIVRCFMYPVKECQGKDSSVLKSRLNTIVPHLYGDHSLCKTDNSSWCSYHKNHVNFRYRSLPGGKPPDCPKLRAELAKLVDDWKERAENLVQLGSTQANENFNFIVSTKAPKNKSFGSSTSFRGRLAASSLQKNDGPQYLTKVNKAIGLSPGEYTMKLACKIAAKRKAKKSTIAAKRKRVAKKINKHKKEVTSMVHEGITYEKEIELSTCLSCEESISEIPKKLDIPADPKYIVFDLETTGRGRQSDIVQIAADDFNVYCIPRCDISSQASAVNGIYFQRETSKMTHHGEDVPCKPIQEALIDFIDFLKEKNKPILVGHNACCFDIPILVNRLKEFNLLTEFSTCIVGFMDTLKISKRVFEKSEVGNYKQQTLVNKYTDCVYNAHDAKEDVRALKILFDNKLAEKVKNEDLFHIFFHYVKEIYAEMISHKVISGLAALKLARNAVGPSHLRLAHSRSSGLNFLLKDMNVTLKRNHLTSLIQFLEKEE